MQSIWKYELHLTANPQYLTVPKDAKTLDVQIQDGKIQAWIQVNADRAETVGRPFWIFGAGHRFADHLNIEYVATVQDGGLVWHIFKGADQ